MLKINEKHNTLEAQELICVDQLCCVRGQNQLFNALSFTVHTGQCIHIIGANGSGKTSLLRILCGLSEAESGQVLWKGHGIKHNDSFFNDMAYIGHKDGLKNELTAFENLRFNQQLNGALDEDIIDDCLSKLSILSCADLLTQSLSFGQRRRLAFAKLLLNPKKLWILDEPFTGIDTTGRPIIERLCVEQLNNGGSILLTHHQSLHNSPLNEFRQELQLSPQDMIEEMPS